MKRILFALCVAVLGVVFTCGTVWAQGTAQINGTVRDSTGAVLPGVDVTVTRTDTGISRTTLTSETGSFILPNLAIGPYTLEASLPGFRAFVQTGIVLQVNSNPVVNVVLSVGDLAERVEVQANPLMVETRSVGVGSIIENERILELPLNGRQATDLIVLSGAAVQTAPSVPDRNMPQVVAMSVAGGLTTGTVYLLDGAMHNDTYSNYNLPFPFPDALQEFKVETGARSAQSGLYSGASVNSVTKSGTNEFHGSLFEFVRNDLFNARNYFATTNSTLKRNQFGGTIGGPIRSNKLFFFAGVQGTTVRQDPADQRSFVPTPAMMAGDFTVITSTQCRARQLDLGSPFSGNRINPALFSRAAVNLANRLPKTSDPCGLVTYGIKQPENEGQYVGRIDYQWNDKHSVFGRTLLTVYKQAVPYTLDPNVLNTTALGFDKRAQSYAIGTTSLIGPNMANAIRLAVNRTAIERLPAEYFSPSDIGVQNWYDYDPTSMRLSVSSGFSIGQSYGPLRNTSYSFNDDLSLIRGTHQIGIGATLAHWRTNLSALTNPSLGGFSFNGQVTGHPMADFLTGKLTSTTQRSPAGTFMSKWYVGTYVADIWQARRGLTFNYGLRWEPYLPQVLRDGVIATFSEERYARGIQSAVFRKAPAGFQYPGDPGFPGTNCRSSGVCSATGQKIKWWELTPRLGLAWDVHGDGIMSVRASYAIGKDMLAAGFYTNFITPPWAASVIFADPPGGFDNPWLGFPGGNPFPPKPLNADIEFPVDSNYIFISEDDPQTTRHSWSLNVDRQIAADLMLSTSYMGSQAHHLWASRQVNSAIFFPGNFDANGTCRQGGLVLTGGRAGTSCSTVGNTNVRRRLALQYPNVGGTPMGFVNHYQAAGTQSYHGLLVSLQRRAARGVTISTNYTWSHCYGDDALASTGGSGGSTYTDPDNRAFDRGNCGSDRRHVFNLTAVAETPQFANPTLRTLGTGWRLSSIYRRSTGSFLTISSGQDRALTGVSGQRAQQVLVNPYGDKKSLKNFLNPAAFTAPDLGSLGNMSPNNVEGPGTWQFDVALSRVFRFNEIRRLEFRAEAYNLTNSLRRGNPNTSINSNTFGQIDTSRDPRIMQFALKYIF